MNFCIVMITMNEQEAVKLQIEEIRAKVKKDVPILIVDSSTDRTPEIAESLGAKVIRQYPPQGYGKAMKVGLIEAAKLYDAIITMDCDMTYPAEEIKNFILLLENSYDCVSGSRLLGKNKGMPLLNKIGNWLFAKFVKLLFGYRTTDLTTGMRAYKSNVIKTISWVPLQFFPAELVIRIHQSKFKIIDLPIEYKERIGEVKMRKFRDLMLLLQAIFYCKFVPVQLSKNY